jgi:hypothetical protein
MFFQKKRRNLQQQIYHYTPMAPKCRLIVHKMDTLVFSFSEYFAFYIFYIDEFFQIYPDTAFTKNSSQKFNILHPIQRNTCISRTFRSLVSRGHVGMFSCHGFVIVRLLEETTQEADPTPGSWEHCKWIAPPWIQLWTRFLPGIGG